MGKTFAGARIRHEPISCQSVDHPPNRSRRQLGNRLAAHRPVGRWTREGVAPAQEG
jgi:hypothetical protein